MPAGKQSTSAIPAITLEEAIQRALTSDPAFLSAVTEVKVAAAGAGIAKSALLPGITYHNQFVYTQPQHVGGKPVVAGTTSPIFIANNGVHEYISQGVATETLGASGYTDYRRANAEAAAARARLEVARRGLVSTVVGSYYGVLVAGEKAEALRQALDEAKHFAIISGELEAGGEVAHADVIKAGLQVQQRQRDLADAELAADKARIDLGVLLFRDPLTAYVVEGDLHAIGDVPSRASIESAANLDNPDVKAAIAAFRVASLELTSSRFDYFPSLTLNYSYGIDAPQFAVTSTDGSRNLGFSAFATLDIPVWDWFATRDRIRQSAARKDLAQAELTNTQRRLAASIEELYREAEGAHEQMQSLDTSLQDAKEALRLTDLRYTNGEAQILEVVDAQNTFITVRSSRADAAARFRTALADLQTLTGTLPQ